MDSDHDIYIYADAKEWAARYRVSFSVPTEVLELGLERLRGVLEEVRREVGTPLR